MSNLSKDTFLELTEVTKGSPTPSLFNISWKLTEWCNYRCEYCFQRNSARTWRDYSIITSAADKINNFINKINRPTKLSLIGGEVTYYDLIDLLKNHLTSENLIKISLTTNLSKSEEYFKELKNYCESRGIKLILTASLHISQIPNIDDFIVKCIHLNCCINSVLTNSNATQLLNILNRLQLMNYDLSKVDLLFDSNEFENRSENCLATYNYWKQSIKKYSANTYRIRTLDGNERLISRAEIKNSISDFVGFKCKGYLRITHTNKVVTGACPSHNNNLTIDDLDRLSLNDLENILTVVCKTKNCSVCLFQKIWRG